MPFAAAQLPQKQRMSVEFPRSRDQEEKRSSSSAWHGPLDTQSRVRGECCRTDVLQGLGLRSQVRGACCMTDVLQGLGLSCSRAVEKVRHEFDAGCWFKKP